MICRIGWIELDAQTISGLDETLSIPFAKIDRAQNHPLYQSAGLSSEEIRVSGTNVKLSLKALEWLKIQSRMKYPVRFTTTTGSMLVLVEEISTKKHTFAKDFFLFQEFEVRMVRHYPDLLPSGLIDIAGALL